MAKKMEKKRENYQKFKVNTFFVHHRSPKIFAKENLYKIC